MAQICDRDRDLLGDAPIDFADEAQRQVELRIALPPRPRNAAHQREQARADRSGGSQPHEQPVHSAKVLAA